MDYTNVILSSFDTMLMSVIAKKEPSWQFKKRAYEKAIAEIKRFGEPIRSMEDIHKIKGLGDKTIDKIRKIIDTGALSAAVRVREEMNIDGYTELLSIHGIGPAKAKTLMESGIHNIAQLRIALVKNPKLLTKAQTLGLKYATDAVKRIPRAELTEHEAILMAGMKGGLDGTIVGSYRRGAATSGDIDMLIRYKKTMSLADAEKAFKDYVSTLEKSGYCIDTLATGDKKWMGYVRLGEKGVVRRLDLLLTPPEQFPFALLYFTGSDQFNVAFRKHCLSLGYTLNEHEMKPTKDGVPAVTHMDREEDIFRFVGLKYIVPTERVNARQIIAS